MAEADIRQECEKRFQNGGPKVFVFDPIANKLTPFYGSIRRAIFNANDGEQVWARRKYGCQYLWKPKYIVEAK